MGILTSTAIECHNKLEKFRKRWPLDKLANLTLEQYTQVGSNDTLCYWLEYGSEELGRVSGQTSMSKYGLWHRKDDKEGRSQRYRDDGAYKWAAKYGETAEMAFDRIRQHVNDIANYASNGQFDLIDGINLHSFAKWKLAFVYSGDNLLPIYNKLVLSRIAQHFEHPAYEDLTTAQLHDFILSFKATDEDVFDFAIKYYRIAKDEYERNYYIIGSKYNDNEDVFPDMIEKSAVSTGFFWGHDFSALVGREHSFIDKNIRRVVPQNTEKFDSSMRTLKHFLSLKVGDIIAIKSHGRFNGLTIIGYAEVKEVDGKVYVPLDDDLGHLINVDFLETHVAIKTGLTYAETIHKIVPGERLGHFEAIFGNYVMARSDEDFLEEEPYLEEDEGPEEDEGLGPSDIRNKDTSSFLRTVSSTTQVVRQIHNTIQNAYALYLTGRFPGEEIKTERSRIDIWRKNATGFYIYEVKPYNTAYACIREALGQLTDYAFSKSSSRPTFLIVVGTAEPTAREKGYIRFLNENLGLKFTYDCFSVTEKKCVSYS